MIDYQPLKKTEFRIGQSGAGASVRRAELVLGGSANGTDPAVREVFEGSVRGNITFRIALRRIVNIAADLTLIFFHNVLHISVTGPAPQAPWGQERPVADGNRDLAESLAIHQPREIILFF